MRLCVKHWADLKAKLPENFWLAANILLMQKLPLHIDMSTYNNNIRIVQGVIEERGGCVICFVGEELLTDVIHEVKSKEKGKIEP